MNHKEFMIKFRINLVYINIEMICRRTYNNINKKNKYLLNNSSGTKSTLFSPAILDECKIVACKVSDSSPNPSFLRSETFENTKKRIKINRQTLKFQKNTYKGIFGSFDDVFDLSIGGMIAQYRAAIRERIVQTSEGAEDVWCWGCVTRQAYRIQLQMSKFVKKTGKLGKSDRIYRAVEANGALSNYDTRNFDTFECNAIYL